MDALQAKEDKFKALFKRVLMTESTKGFAEILEGMIDVEHLKLELKDDIKARAKIEVLRELLNSAESVIQ